MPDASLSDADLIAGCLSGKPGAWESFVTRFSRLVYWSIHRSLQGSMADRQDVVDDIYQEVFRQLLEKDELSRLREATSVRKFLCVIAAHRTLDRLKSLKRTEERSVDLETAGDAAVFAVPPLTPNRERDDLIARAIETLNPKERFCVQMHYYEDLPHREIAALLGIPQDTVSSIIRRTREKLKAKFLEAGLKGYSE